VTEARALTIEESERYWNLAGGCVDLSAIGYRGGGGTGIRPMPISYSNATSPWSRAPRSIPTLPGGSSSVMAGTIVVSGLLF
jgi:hypothetical protein